MARVKPLVLLPPLIFAGLAALFYLGMQREDPDALPSAVAGSPAPAVAVVPLGDGPVLNPALLKAPGVKLVNFWASWCAPCRVEHPNLMAMAGDGVEILGVNWKDKPDQGLGFLADMGDPFAKVGADPKNRMGLDWGVAGVPETFVVDGEGKVVLRIAGPVTEEILNTRLRPALEAAK